VSDNTSGGTDYSISASKNPACSGLTPRGRGVVVLGLDGTWCLVSGMLGRGSPQVDRLCELLSNLTFSKIVTCRSGDREFDLVVESNGDDSRE